jgi:hypothetical protein
MQQKNRIRTTAILERMLEIDGRIYLSKSDNTITLRDRQGRHVNPYRCVIDIITGNSFHCCHRIRAAH